MPLTPSTTRTARLGVAALACFTLVAFAGWVSPSGTPAPPRGDAPDGLVITSPRICAALAVYGLAGANDWTARAAVATTALNAFRDTTQAPDCAAGVTAALTRDFQPSRWQLALDSVDAVLAGTSQLSPAAWARAKAATPLMAEDGKEPSTMPVLARAHCVVNELAHLEVAP